jgi:hypothetical protein
MDGSGFRMKVSALSFFLVYCRTTTTGRRPIMRRKAQACMAQLASHRIACFRVGAYPWPLAKWHCGNEGVRMNRGWTRGYVRTWYRLSHVCPYRCVVGAVVRPTRTPATVSHLPAEPTGMCMRKAPRRQGGNGRSCMGPIPGRRSMPSEASTVVDRSVDSESCFTAMVTRAMQRRLVAMVPVVLGHL